MPHISTKNPKTFAGDFSPFARSLANWAIAQLCSARSHLPFISKHPSGRYCAIFPTITAGQIKATVFYSLRRTFPIERLADARHTLLLPNWRKYCRAFVIVSLDPTQSAALTCVDHHATDRALIEVLKAGPARLPWLSEIDAALSTSLEFVESAGAKLLRLTPTMTQDPDAHHQHI